MPMGPLRIAYGSRPEQFGDLRVPKGSGPFPVVVVIHGGCWVNFYGLDLMHDMSDVLTAQGLATWNIEYRRIGDAESTYPNTMLDVGLAIDHLRKIAAEHRLDLAKVTTVGHSAGGHLAIWAAARAKLDNQNPLHGADPLPIRASVALAGVLDLAESIDLGVCNGTAGKLMQGTPAEVPAHYAESSPKELLPIPVPQRLIHGNADFLSKLDFNVRFEVLEMELVDNLGFIRTKSVGTIVPKGQTPTASEGNRELFVVKKVNGKWLFHRYIFNPEVKAP